jgi:hypothetical protein
MEERMKVCLSFLASLCPSDSLSETSYDQLSLSCPLGPLKIGDYITLKNLRMESYLSAEGILCEDIILSQDLNSFEDSVFCIHFLRQYSAARELEEFLVTYEVDVNNITDANTNKFLHALQVSFTHLLTAHFLFSAALSLSLSLSLSPSLSLSVCLSLSPSLPLSVSVSLLTLCFPAPRLPPSLHSVVEITSLASTKLI